MPSREPENTPDNYTKIAGYRQRFLHRITNGAGILPIQIFMWIASWFIVVRILRLFGALSILTAGIAAFGLLRLVQRLDRQFTDYKSPEEWLKSHINRRIRPKKVINFKRERASPTRAIHAVPHTKRRDET